MTQQRDSFHTLTVLIADGHLASRRIPRTMLLQFGVKTLLEAATPDDAARAFREHPVDIVFLDLDFGGAEQGFMFLRQIRDREHSRDPFVPVVIMGHQVGTQSVAAARDCGAHEFLIIPVTTEAVQRKLLSVTLRPRPFVQGPTYFGPDRRRQRGTPPGGHERRWDGPGSSAS